MNYQVHITSRAEQDLSEAADYIEFSLKNPQAAEDLLDEAERRISSLTEFPERAPLAEDPVLAAWEIRFITVKNYLAFYHVDCEKQLVTIVRFLYKRRNWNHILKLSIENSKEETIPSE